MNDRLKKALNKLPATPGVYLMKDKEGRVIYIGKAKDLKNRVSSYFHSSADPKHKMMLSCVDDIDYLETASEIEAIMLEARLIKDIQPRFNVIARDDKSFGMICITDYDDFPKVWFVREKDEVNGQRYGPFVGAIDLRRAIGVLQKIFKFAVCKLKIYEDDNKRRFVRPCLLYSIKRCSAPCAGKISKDEYAQDIDSFKRFLTGQKDKLIQSLKRLMREAADALNFERASELRDQLKAIGNLDLITSKDSYDLEAPLFDPKESLNDLQRLLNLDFVPQTIEACDISNIHGKYAVGSIVTFLDGVPFKSGYRRFKIKTINGIDDYAMMREVITRRFKRLKEEGIFPDIFLIDGGKGHLAIIGKTLDKMKIKKPVILALAKKEEKLLIWGEKGKITTKESSPGLRLLMYVRDEAHRFALHYHQILRKKGLRNG